jgi:protoporphyrinogen oxidase
MKIAIIGGGMMGLTLAYRLSQQGHRVSVFESSPQLGGLTTSHDYGTFTWDRFYHVLLPSDTHLLGLFKEIGLESQVQWRKTRTGYYVDRQLYSISNTLEFLRFPPLSLVGKLRLAFTLLYGARVKNWRKLEQISVEDWLLRLSGRATYEKFWKPLLLAKLGESYRRVSAVFIWSYIKRLASARDTTIQKEQLGYVTGGYKTVFDRLAALIRSRDGEIHTSTPVTQISSAPQTGLWVEHSDRKEHFDRVFFTAPTDLLDKVAAKNLVTTIGDNHPVEYLGAICMVLVTRKPLIPYYVVNIADPQVPFTGAIGMSNLVSREETNGLHLTYLPKYALSSDPIFKQTDEELQALFFKGVRRMFPTRSTDEIVSIHINRATKVQPLQVLNYSNLVPQTTTLHKDLFILNTSQFVNDTLNNNTVVQHVNGLLTAMPTSLPTESTGVGKKLKT